MNPTAEHVDFPALGRKVSRVGFGCCPMGGHGWGHTDSGDLVDSVHAALDVGVNLFDTADVYGLGQSEELLGRALIGYREKAVIATKGGVRRQAETTCYDNSGAWLRQAVEASLRRLGTDYIDLYQLHYWDHTTPLAEVLEVFADLRQQGKILSFGLTNLDPAAHGIDRPVDGLASVSRQYSLAERTFEPEITATIENLGTCFLSWGSLGQGILSGKYTATSRFAENDRRSRAAYVNFHGDRLRRNMRIVDCMRRIQSQYREKTLAQIAVRWILDRIPKSIALVGIKRPDQLTDLAAALDWHLDQPELAELAELSSDAPCAA